MLYLFLLLFSFSFSSVFGSLINAFSRIPPPSAASRRRIPPRCWWGGNHREWYFSSFLCPRFPALLSLRITFLVPSLSTCSTQSLYKNGQIVRVVRYDQRNNELFQIRFVVLGVAMGHILSELARRLVYIAFFMLVLTLKAYWSISPPGSSPWIQGIGTVVGLRIHEKSVQDHGNNCLATRSLSGVLHQRSYQFRLPGGRFPCIPWLLYPMPGQGAQGSCYYNRVGRVDSLT